MNISIPNWILIIIGFIYKGILIIIKEWGKIKKMFSKSYIKKYKILIMERFGMKEEMGELS